MTVFVDATKQASPWTSAASLSLDRLGYPRSLAPGQVAESVVYATASHPAGDFTLLYSGRGEIAVEGGAVQARSEGRIVVRVAPNTPRVALLLKSTDRADYVHDVHFIVPGFEPTYAIEPFFPKFVEALRGLALVRFATWMRASISNVSAVSVLRPTTGTYTQAGPLGIAPEYAVALANALGAQPWFTLPAGATDGYAYAFADVVHRQLDPRLRAAFEYGDRIWDPGVPANAWSLMAGHNLHLAGDARQAALDWYALRSTQLFGVEQRAFGRDAARMVRVLSGPVDDAASLAIILSYASGEHNADAFYAVSPPREDASRLLGASRLRILTVQDLASARAYGTAHPAERVAPNPALHLVATAAADEAVEEPRGVRPPRVAPLPATPNVVPEAVTSRPVLDGEVGDPLAAVNLTREGSADWVHFGATTVRKANSPAQIGFARLGNAPVRAAGSTFAKYSWRDGMQMANGSARGGLAVSGVGNGFTLSAPADSTTRTLRVYVGAQVAGASPDAFRRCSATAAAPVFLVDSSLESGSRATTGVFTFVYRASRPGQQIKVSYITARAYGAAAGAVLEAATLQEAGRAAPQTATDMPTFHNDNLRTGWNPNETTLNTTNVRPSQFAKLQTLAVDGVVLAQPLYVANYTFPSQGTHNVLIVATEHNTLYEFDADTYQLLNSRNFGPSQNSNDVGCSDISPEYGITSTPVIDRSTNTIYLVAAIEPSSGSFQHVIHAVDIGTLADQQNAMPIAAQVLMTNGKHITFDPQNQQSRTSLAFNNGSLYVGIGSHCDNDSSGIVGFMLKYDGGLNQVASFATAEDTVSYLLDSIWMAGYASAFDANGNVLSVTGNGAFDAQNAGHNYGESVMKLDANLAGVQSFFTPTNWQQLNSGDTDFGSGGVMLLPPQQSTTPNIAVAMGKDSNLYVLNEDSLGGLGGYLQKIPAGGNGVCGVDRALLQWLGKGQYRVRSPDGWSRS